MEVENGPVTSVYTVEADDSRSHTANRKPQKRGLLISYKVLDAFVSLALIGPLCLFYWQGTWGLLNLYVYPDSPVTRGWVCFSAGVGVQVILTGLQNFFEKLCRTVGMVKFFLVSRTYNYVISLACVAQWDGVWELCPHYLNTKVFSWKKYLGFIISAVFLMMLLRGVRNLVSPPLVVLLDHKRGITFHAPTMLGIQSSRPALYIIDILFTFGVVGTLGIAIWWSVWSVLDNELYPKDMIKSYVVSASGGYSIAIFCLFYESLARIISASLDERLLVKLLFEDVFFLIKSYSTLNIWRGMWGLADLVIFPSQKVLSLWFCHCTGFFLMVLTLSSNSIAGRGREVDGSQAAGAGVFSPIRYFSILVPPDDTLQPPPVLSDRGGYRY